MTKHIHRLTVRPALPEALDGLEVLARTLRWTWHRGTRDLFRSIDRAGWDRVECNPLRLLDAVGPERLQELADDPAFRGSLLAALADLERYLSEPRWYQGLEGVPEQIG